MKTSEKKIVNRNKYPVKSFIAFLALYIIGLVAYYPILKAQAELYIEIMGDTAYTASQLAGLSALQPLLMAIIVVYFGNRYAQRVNLRSLITEQVEGVKGAKQGEWLTSLKESVPFIALSAIVIALLHLSFDFIFQNWLPTHFQPSFNIPNGQQFISNLFYSGLGQEILLRFGVMTIVVYVFSSRGKELDRWVYIVGIVFTAVVYTVAQSNSMFATGDLTPVLFLRLMLLTGLDGILYGSLYYKFHVEAAMLSHVLANLFIVLGNVAVVMFSS